MRSLALFWRSRSFGRGPWGVCIGGWRPSLASVPRAMTGLTARQQSRLVMYLDDALLRMARAFQKRYVHTSVSDT